MKKIFLPILSVILSSALFYNTVNAQSVSVDNFSGSANLSIPLVSLQYGGISMPIGISYNGGGIRVKDVEGSAGMGWNLFAGGQISRQVRGIPDDTKQDNFTAVRLGWIYNTNGSKINSFNIANDNNPATTTDESADLAYLSANFSDFSDTEPDIFYVNAPGLSCKLVFDNDHNIRTIPYQDIKVTYEIETTVPNTWDSYGRIKSFTITTATGTTYIFSALEITRKMSLSSTPSNIQYFKREYEQYKNGITYVSAWKLSSIVDINGNNIDLFYQEASGAVSSTDRMAMFEGTNTTPTYPFTYSIGTNQINLFQIQANDYPIANFTYRKAYPSSVSMVTSIVAQGKTISLGYTDAQRIGSATEYKSFLNSVGGDNPLSFDYYGLEGYNIALPDSLSKEIDLWGYYNNATSATSLLPNVYINPGNVGYEHYRNMPTGSASSSFPYGVTGFDRYVNASVIINGSLKKINYEHGGSTTIVYEPRDYYDPTAGGVTVGGGIRVKQLIDYDGISTANNRVTNYSYINPSTGLSSGKPIALPLLTFTRPYIGSGTTESQWQNSIVRLEENISQEDNAIVYSHVKVARTGEGSTLFEYKVPATYWDASAAPDWMPTIVNIARPVSVSGGFTSNEVNTYPFVPNTNFDFERGLLSKVIQYNESGNKVTESTYNYMRSGSPLIINALKFDDNVSVKAYAKYSIYSSIDNLIQTESSIVYDAPSTTQYNQTSTNYSYASSVHKEPTLIQRTNSDGSISRVYTKYIKDYSTASASDQQTISLYNLQQKGVNFPIETYSQIERSGQNKTISASLIKLKPWTFGGFPTLNLPQQRLALVSASGLADFVPSNTSGGSFSNDSRYLVKENFQSYNHYGQLLTSDDNNRNVNAVITNLQMSRPTAVFSNAAIEEVAYNDFDDIYSEYKFVNSGTSNFSTNKRSGTSSLSIDPTNYFTRNITKAPTRKNYIFSIWINSSSTGNITLSLTNSSSSTLTYNLPFTNTSGAWKYYEIKVPVVAMSDAFTAKFQSDASILIDDVLFYPSDASVNTMAYDPSSFLKTAETNSNGVSQYFEYDSRGRVKHVLDQDKNIVLKKSYVRGSEVGGFSAWIRGYENLLAGAEATLYDGGSLVSTDDVVKYTWDFGDGTPIQSTSALIGQINHTYANTGTYTITLTKSSELLGTKTVTQSVTVNTNNTAAVIGGAGPITLSFFQGGSLMYTFSGSSLWNATASVAPGTYSIQFSTTDNPYNAGSNPYGYKKYVYALYNTSGSGYQLENCFPSSSSSHSTTFSLNILPGRQYYFTTSTTECVIEEVQ